MSQWPEHDKVKAHQNETQTVFDFLEWCASQGILLAREGDDERFPSTVPHLEDLLADWVGVDLARFYAEKDDMLDQLRRANGDGG